MKEAINKFYIENAEVKSIEEWNDYQKNGAVYEVIKIINGVPLFYEEHFKRMKNSFSIKNISFQLSEDEVLNYIYKLIDSNKVLNGNVKIVYSTEIKEMRIFYIKHSYPTSKMYENGVECITYFGERNDPNAKVINSDFRSKINNVLKNKRAYEAILVNRNGLITEGSRSNLFLIKDETIYTSESRNVLQGVTRTEIIKEANESGIIIKEKCIYLKKLNEYDAAFISGTSPNILPLSSIDDIEFDVNNITLRKIMDKFNLRIEKYIQ